MSKIILTHDVDGLGTVGDVVEVKNGYARNYLVPQGYAVAWTRGGEKQVEQMRAARSARELATQEEAEALKSALENTVVTLSVRAGRDGRLFGSVTPSDVATAVHNAGNTAVDRRKVRLDAPIKRVGDHSATVRLRDDISATVTLRVVAQK